MKPSYKPRTLSRPYTSKKVAPSPSPASASMRFWCLLPTPLALPHTYRETGQRLAIHWPAWSTPCADEVEDPGVAWRLTLFAPTLAQVEIFLETRAQLPLPKAFPSSYCPTCYAPHIILMMPRAAGVMKEGALRVGSGRRPGGRKRRGTREIHVRACEGPRNAPRDRSIG